MEGRAVRGRPSQGSRRDPRPDEDVTLEEAWAVVTGAGFSHQFDDSWLSIHPEQVLVGRALTSQWLPGRPTSCVSSKPRAAQGRESAGPTPGRSTCSSRVTSTSPITSASRRTAPPSATTSAARSTRSRQRHRLRRRRSRHQRPARPRALHVVRPLLRPVAPRRQRQRRRAPQLDDDRHQRADPRSAARS